MATTACRVCHRESTTLRWACPLCVRDTWRRLDEIQDHVIIIGTVGLLPSRSVLDGLPRAGGYGPREPLNLDKLVALDYRSHVDGNGTDDDPHEATLSILGSLSQIGRYVWSRRVDDDHPDSRPLLTVPSLARYLRINAEWCTWQTWGDQFVLVVKQLHAQTCRQAHDAPPKPLGSCLTPGCAGTVFQTARGGRCSEPCSGGGHRLYNGLDLQRLAEQKERHERRA
jgi:hypothetical protein